MSKLTYTIPETAEQLSVSVRVVERLIAATDKDGKDVDPDLTSFKVGRRRLVAHDDLVEYIDRQRRVS